MSPIARNKGMDKHLGMSKTLEAFAMVSLVDMFGDVPYSEAVTSVSNPKLDSGASVYDSALTLLDEANAHFSTTTPSILNSKLNDLFYNKNWTNWIRLVNTIKLKIYIQRRLVDANAIASFNAIIASGNYIQNSSQDFQFRWGNSINNPDTRHPRYVDSYSPTGVAAGYQANWLLDVMRNEKSVQDSRMKYYFYRQVNATVVNEQDIRCSVEPAPAHYVGRTDYCIIPNADGYWGRDHGNNEGIPNDRAKRTAMGVYPAGGRFDDNRFTAISSLTEGAQGAGITPLLLASTVDFWLAEMALVQGQDATAKQFILDGIQKSFTKVRSFGPLDTTANQMNAPALANDVTYITEVGTLFDNATSPALKMDRLMTEFFITLFGNGLDAYNAYRRTGFPSDLQPNIEPDPGFFIRSFLYPANEANTNINVNQKPNVRVRVFWDNNPEVGFPFSN